MKSADALPSPRSRFSLLSQLYLLLLAAHIGLVWLLPYFPSQDGPSHLYNLIILRDLIQGGREWGAFYSYDLQPVPNLGYHLVAYPLLSIFPPLVVDKLFVTIFILLLACSVPLLLRAFNRPALPLSFLVFPILFNFNLMIGFYSYCITIPLLLLALAAIWRSREYSFVGRFIICNLLGSILYIFHLIPLLFFLFFIVALACLDWSGYRKLLAGIGRQLLLVSPLLLMVGLYVTRRLANPTDLSYLWSFKRVAFLLPELVFFSTMTFSPYQLLPGIMLPIAVYPLLKMNLRHWQQAESPNPAMHYLSIINAGLLLLFFVAPFRFGEGCYFNQRFPWVILLTTLPMLAGAPTDRWRRLSLVATIGIAVVSLACNTVILHQEANRVQRFLGGLKAELPQGALIMPYRPNGPAKAPVDALMHAVSYYGIVKGVVNLGNYETGYDLFPVHFRKELPPVPTFDQINFRPGSIDLASFPAVAYLIGWEVDTAQRSRLQRHFRIITEENSLSIWKRL